MSALFDFNDLGDLPAGLAAKLSSGGAVNPNIAVYADIVKAGSAAGYPVMSGRMIEAVAFRMDLPVLSENAQRNALNGAVKAGLIKKVSRQTYGVVEAPGTAALGSGTSDPAPEVAKTPEVEVATATVDEMPVDPLA